MTNNFSFNVHQFNEIFPFFIKIDGNLNIVDLGKSMSKLIDFQTEKNFNKFFSITTPTIRFNSLRELITLKNQPIEMDLSSTVKIKFQGQFIHLDKTEEILFLGAPSFDSLKILPKNNFKNIDFSTVDASFNSSYLLKDDENISDLKSKITLLLKQNTTLKEKYSELFKSALFPKQNPDPNIRINYEGDVLQYNPAASNLDFIDFKGKTYRNEVFFKFIVKGLDKEIKRWRFEARSNKIDYSFDCVAMPEMGYINIYGRDITLQKKDQQELEKLSLIVQETMNAVIVTNPDGRIDWVNKSFEKMTGYTLSEVKGIKPGTFLQGKDTNPETVAYMQQQIKKQQPFTCEILNFNKTGKPYWLRINGQPIFDENGNLTNFFAIEEDITKEKQSQEKIKAASSRMSSLISNLQDAILLENDNQKIELVNDRFCQMFNIPASPQQMIGLDCSRMTEESKHLFVNPDLFASNIHEIINNKKLVIADQLTLVNGNILERSFIPIWNEDNYEGHLWVYSDVTEKMYANKKMEDLRIFYEKILDNIPSDIAVFDKEHHYLYVNPTGIKDAKIRNWIIGKRDEDYAKMLNKPQDIFIKRRKLFDNIIQSKQLKSWEEELKQLDGTSKYILRNMYPVLNNQNEVDMVIGYGVDITDIKIIQQQKEESEKNTKRL